MNPSSVAPEQPVLSDQQDPPFSPAPVEELLRLFTKAARARQLYLPNNPMYRSALDALSGGFATIWRETDDLTLAVNEHELTWYGVSVLSEGAASGGRSSENLAWLLYKDGLRELRLQRGVEDSEILRLLDIVQRARKATPSDDDLITMLWEADFALISYRYVDVLMDGTGGELADGDTEMRPAAPGEVRAAANAAVEESRASGVVNMADFDATLYFLDEKEIEYLRDEIDREYRQDLRSNVVDGLLDIFEQQADSGVRAEVIDHLETMLTYMLAAGHFRGVARLLEESRSAAGKAAGLIPEMRDRLERLSDRLSSGGALSQLLQSLDDAPNPPSRDELAALFDQLRPEALGTVFQWLRRLRSEPLRALLAEVAGRLASMNTAELVRLVQSPDRDISTEAIVRSGALKAQAAVLALSRVLGEEDPSRRQLAAQALAEIASPGALQALEKILEDSDREVRITGARALAARNYRPMLPRLEAIVRGKPIREADLTEKTVFFDAFGSVCGDAGVTLLGEILNGKGFLGRREDPELRACAAIALGRVGTPAALAQLQKSTGDKEIVVRNAVTRALRGAPGGRSA